MAAWFSDIGDDDIFLSVLTIGELRQRIERIKRRQSKKAVELDSWLHTMLEAYEDRILPIDRSVAEEWGRMNFPDPLPAIDGLLAATAKIYGLCFVTRNTKDIARTGVTCLNPFS